MVGSPFPPDPQINYLLINGTRSGLARCSTGAPGSCGAERVKQGGKEKKKPIKNKILASQLHLELRAWWLCRIPVVGLCLAPLPGCSSCARVTARGAMPQLGGRAKSRIWEKAAFKHRWIQPLFLFKLDFSMLATLG